MTTSFGMRRLCVCGWVLFAIVATATVAHSQDKKDKKKEAVKSLEKEDKEKEKPRSEATLEIGKQKFKMTHCVAFAGTLGDEPCTYVYFCEQPIDMKELKKALADGEEESFGSFHPELKLVFNADGELTYLFAWADNNSINRGGTIEQVKSEFKMEQGRAKGKSVAAEPMKLFQDLTFKFDSVFDVEVITK